MKTKLTLLTVLAAALFVSGCASTPKTISSELKGITWAGYWTDGGQVLTGRMDKKGEEYFLQWFYQDHIKASNATLKIHEIKGGEITFLAKGSDAKEYESGKNLVYTARMVGDGEKLDNGARYEKGEKSNITFELVRAK